MRCGLGLLLRTSSSAIDDTTVGPGSKPRRKRGPPPTAPTIGMGLRRAVTALKVQMTSMKVKNDRIKGYRHQPQELPQIAAPGALPSVAENRSKKNGDELLTAFGGQTALVQKKMEGQRKRDLASDNQLQHDPKVA